MSALVQPLAHRVSNKCQFASSSPVSSFHPCVELEAALS